MRSRKVTASLLALSIGLAGFWVASRVANRTSGMRARALGPDATSTVGGNDGGSFVTSPVKCAEVLIPPDFDDVSAFRKADIARVDAWLREQVALAQYPSLSVAVIRDDVIVYQRAFGFANIESQWKATSETPYNVASVTKAFTTLLALMLHERDVVDLDQPVVNYLPRGVQVSTQPELGATITLRQLASHTSGLPRGVPGPVQSIEDRYAMEPRRLYDHLAKVNLVSTPGTDELYSNLGMGLLGHALERAAGMPYDRLVQQVVLQPMQLSRTDIGNDQLRVATGYSGNLPRRPEEHSFRERLASSGGLVSSSTDLARFLGAHMKTGLLSPEIVDAIHNAPTNADGSPARRTFGWSLRSRDSVDRILKKNGGRNNCSAWIGFAPDHETGVAVITNCGDPNVDPIGYWLLERSIPGIDSDRLNRTPVMDCDYAKVAPFTGVRWTGGQPNVCVNGLWSPVVSIDGIAIERIMDFSLREFGDRAKKRIAEDLVEVLATMGHRPEWEVTMELENADGKVDKVRVEMTERNRQIVRENGLHE